MELYQERQTRGEDPANIPKSGLNRCSGRLARERAISCNWRPPGKNGLVSEFPKRPKTCDLRPKTRPTDTPPTLSPPDLEPRPAPQPAVRPLARHRDRWLHSLPESPPLRT